MLRRSLIAGLLTAGLVITATGGAGGGTPIIDRSLARLGLTMEQSRVWSDRLVNVGDDWGAFGWGGDASVPATISADDAPWTTPLTIGVNFVRWQDPERLPVFSDGFETGDVVSGSVGGGPALNYVYLVMTVVVDGDIPLDMSNGLHQQVDFVMQIAGRPAWEALDRYPDDTWHGGAFVSSLALGPQGWGLSFYSFDGAGNIVTNDLPGFALVEGNTILMGVQVDSTLIPTFDLAGRVAYEIKDAPINPELSRVVTAPAAPLGETEFFDYLSQPIVLTPGFPEELRIEDFRAFTDSDGNLWFKLIPAVPWGDMPPDGYFSDYVQFAVRPYDSTDNPHYFGFQTHDGVSEVFAGLGSEEFDPMPAFVMNDGVLLLGTGVPYDGGPLELQVQSGFLATEESQFQSSQVQFRVEESEIGTTDEPTRYDGEYPVYDLVTGTPLETPPDVVDTTTTSTSTTQPATTVTTVTTVTTLGPTTERPRPTTTGTGETCWWCWGSIALFVAVLLCALFLWLKTYEWWTCWLPWFIVIFAWVPFLLAALWFWRPTWWWVPLLAWFPIVAGYWWGWARHRSWWKPWHLYVVAGYLAALVVGMVLVGAPEWGLLFPLFWVPWVAFYFWFRGARQPWFRPWMWGLALGYSIWVFVWVAALTPWWAWWLPVVLVPFVWWWLVAHGHNWQELRGPKWCWALPFTLLPFLAWWIPIWEPWWCLAIVVFLVLHLFCAVFTHFREQEWWTWWLVWFLIGFVWVPFLLAALWFFHPWWWGWALLPWFVVVPLAAWRWGRLQPWWNHNLWYLVVGYLAVAGGVVYVVGAPKWGLLFPVFWLPWVGLWLWYRGRLQPWWRPWMYALVLGYAAFVIVWVGWLTPFWGWWFPVALFPFLGWWFVDHDYEWALIHHKSCFLIPWCLAPWLGYMTAVYCIAASSVSL
ncbi:MAG: hypothetical protein A2135_11900 [Actinobacteria bacterium RBG_16_67_15]|nr:MAG: hypothetical protein A2135_11900 [Actinobacteria bacterium RBG_16_67_15]